MGCQSVQYHDPIPMSQKEIEEMSFIDVHKRRSKPSAGQISDCYTTQALGEKNCAQIICKDDKTQPTGLTCDIYLPKSVKTDGLMKGFMGTSSTKDEGLQKQIHTFVTGYEAGQKTDLEKFCNRDTVVCYFKSKPFPFNKPPSSAKLSTLIHKESTTMNSENLEISVFKD